MNKEIFDGKWEEVKGKMKQAWGKLTDDDFTQIEGNHQEIYGKLKQYYGYGKDEAERSINDFKNKFNSRQG